MKILLVDGFGEQNPIIAAAKTPLVARGHEVTMLDLVEQGFNRFMSSAERLAYHEVDNLVTPEQRTSAALVRSHDALLLCGPIIEGTIAPCIKSWLERVFIPEVSFTFTKSGRVTGALKHIRRVGMVVADPEPEPWAHRRQGSARSVIRGIRMSSTLTCRTTYTAMGPSDDVSARVQKALARW